MKNINTLGYDNFKESDSFDDCLRSEIVFLCLPTVYDNEKKIR